MELRWLRLGSVVRAVADIADKVRGFVAGGVYLGQQERC